MTRATSEDRLGFDLPGFLRALASTDRPFLDGGQTVHDLLGVARSLRERLGELPTGDRPLCVLTQNRATIAAALLASLGGAPRILIPHADSPRLIEEVRSRIDPLAVLVDDGPAAVHDLPTIRAPRVEPRETPPEPIRGAEEPFVQLFTGGSTGKPVQWTKTPRNLLGEAAFLARRFSAGPGDLILSTVPPRHIYGLLFTVLLPLVSGACVMSETAYFPGEIAEILRSRRCTVLVGAPAHYRSLTVDELAENQLRLAFSSGGTLEEADAARFWERSGVGVSEVYGSTETGGIASRCRASGDTHWLPFEPVKWKIDDERLCVDTPFLSPDVVRDSSGFYRTGDRATDTGDGRFTLLGRADGIVKVGGKRVDLAEVEDRIRRLPFVSEAAVFALPAAGARENEIVALVVTSESVERTRSAIADGLEPHEMPRRIRAVDAIPTSAAGKRDHTAAIALFRG